MKNRKKNRAQVQYIPGAADDGLGFFPAITCQSVVKGRPKILWVVFQRRRQGPDKQAALEAANDAIALGFQNPALPGKPERFLAHLREHGFSNAPEHRVADSFDQDRRAALGPDYEPPPGDAAARHDPVLHATIMQMVKQQLDENDPPETRETFERLMAEGYSPEHVRRLVGYLVALELTQSMLSGIPFDKKRFIESLRRLPEIPPP